MKGVGVKELGARAGISRLGRLGKGQVGRKTKPMV